MVRLLLLLSIILNVQLKASGQVASKTNKNAIIKGTIKDENNKPVPYAFIKIKNETDGITSDSLGAFLITVKVNTALIISSVGFDSTEVFIKDNKTLLFNLKKNGIMDKIVPNF